MTIDDLATALRNLRVSRGRTVAEQAQRMGVVPFTLARWEAAQNLQQIAAFLHAVEVGNDVQWVLKQAPISEKPHDP